MKGTHEEVKDMIASYVLGAVPEEEMPMIRSHIISCELCMEEAESYSRVTSSLAHAIDPVPLPEGFAERTLAKVGENRDSLQPASVPARRWSLGWVLSTAALVLVIVASAFVLWQTRSELDTNKQIVAALLEEEGVPLQGEGVGRIVATEDGTKFVAEGLDPAPEGKVYQLWKMSDGCPTGNDCTIGSAGTFAVENGLVVADAEGSLSEFSEAAVTLEVREVDAPTTEPVMASF